MECETVTGGWEDHWDEIVTKQMQDEGIVEFATENNTDTSGVDRDEDPRWSDEPRMIDFELGEQIRADDQKNAEMGKKLWEVAAKERDLAEEEKRAAKVQRRLARKGPAYLEAVERAARKRRT